MRRLRLLVADMLIGWHEGRIAAHVNAVEQWRARWYRWERRWKQNPGGGR